MRTFKYTFNVDFRMSFESLEISSIFFFCWVTLKHNDNHLQLVLELEAQLSRLGVSISSVGF